jgi:hypothetical protein
MYRRALSPFITINTGTVLQFSPSAMFPRWIVPPRLQGLSCNVVAEQENGHQGKLMNNMTPEPKHKDNATNINGALCGLKPKSDV